MSIESTLRGLNEYAQMVAKTGVDQMGLKADIFPLQESLCDGLSDIPLPSQQQKHQADVKPPQLEEHAAKQHYNSSGKKPIA